MKNYILSSIVLLLLSGNAFAQNCNLALKEAGKVTLHIKTFNTPMLYDMKFTKYKDDKKDEIVTAFNAGIVSGSTKAASDYPLIYNYKKASTPGGDEYKMGTTISGTEYFSYAVCKNDTMFYARNRGVVEVPDGKGGIYGYSIQGIQVVPMHLKVGDTLPLFTDLSVVLPTTTDITVKKKILDHYSTSTSNGFGYAQDKDGNWGLGPTIETKTTAVWNTVDVAVKKTVGFSNHTLHFSNVTGEEEVTVNGVKYKAYIIDGETWTKTKMEVDFQSMDEQINRQQKLFAEKVQAKMAKMMVRRQFTNSDGYMVMFSRSWFVPTIGMVKMENYDMAGGIASITTIEKVE